MQMEGNVTSVTLNKQSASINRLLIIIIVIIFILISAYLLISYYYSTHFFINTVINGVDVSNMTAEQAEEAIHEEFKKYSLTLEGRNELTGQIQGKEFNIRAKFDGNLEDLLRAQNSFMWFSGLFKTSIMEIPTIPEYDEELLKNLVLTLPFFDEKNVIEPVDAYISEYIEGKGYEIIPEVPGTKVIFNKLFEVVKKSINNLESMISLEEDDCYYKPKLTSDSPSLIKTVNELNKIVGAEIIYEFGEDTEIVDGAKISQWLSVSDNGSVILDESGVKEFVDYIGKTYNTFGKTRKFKTSYGTEINVKGGDYGWWLNRPLEVTELMELILAGEKVKREPAYYQKARQYGEDNIGDTYVEVSLATQHLFFYKNGKLILESDFVSGNLAKGHGTPTGTYPIKYKQRKATLTGDDYSVPVEYWMPFNGDIGFHDAWWRKEFGKNIYKTDGSHGCINLPANAAKIMYENIEPGVAVVVY